MATDEIALLSTAVLDQSVFTERAGTYSEESTFNSIFLLKRSRVTTCAS